MNTNEIKEMNHKHATEMMNEEATSLLKVYDGDKVRAFGQSFDDVAKYYGIEEGIIQLKSLTQSKKLIVNCVKGYFSELIVRNSVKGGWCDLIGGEWDINKHDEILKEYIAKYVG